MSRPDALHRLDVRHQVYGNLKCELSIKK